MVKEYYFINFKIHFEQQVTDHFDVGIKTGFIPDLIHSHEETVDIVSWGAWVQCVFVLLDLHLDKLSHLLNIGKNFMLWARQMLHYPGEDVVHL